MPSTYLSPRPIDVTMTLAQIGRLTVAAVSGGRVERLWVGPNDDRYVGGIRLPVSYGYAVEVWLDASDTYTVRKTWTRSGVTKIREEWSDVYADELDEAVYRASLREA